MPYSEDLVPAGSDTSNAYLNYRNSFYWDKKSWHDYPSNFTKAHIYHFLHNQAGTIACGILESEKASLENRVWYNYQGQYTPYRYAGSNGSPTKIARVLDDGSTQLYQYDYNALGKVIKYVDPVGRSTTNVYSTNNIDLLEVRQIAGTNKELLARFTWNTNHLPLTAVDAAGQTNYFRYSTVLTTIS